MADYILYSYFRSSCSARVRIALNLKSISYDLRPVNLLKDEQISEEHRKLNPSGSVPLLIIQDQKAQGEEPNPLRIGQSVAILEYLEEAHPEGVSLLPEDLRRRAVVRSLVNIISADTQPPTNLRITKRVKSSGGDVSVWMKEIMSEGLQAYESVAKVWAGRYSVGDEVTMADVCLLPAVWNAERYGVDVANFPTVSKIAGELERLEAVQKAHYFNQPDTPEELRGPMPPR